MLTLRPVLVGCGLVLCLLALAMMVPAAFDTYAGNQDDLVFIASSGVTLFAGLALILSFRFPKMRRQISLRHLALLSCSGSVLASVAAALPFMFSSRGLSLADALFEAVSGLTATGSTVLQDLAHLPPGLLVWRAMLQWLGGAGALVLAVMVLPTLQVGGMQLFRIETVGSADRARNRASKLAAGVLGLYAMLTLLILVLLLLAGMDLFPAFLHALTGISCGGFSTADASIGNWGSPAIEWVMLLAMLLGGGPFVVYLALVQRRWRRAFETTQWRWYLGLLGLFGAILGLWLWGDARMGPLAALRHGLFAAASLMTGSGFVALDFGHWNGLPAVLLFFLAFLGGCSGSASGGIKIFRIQLLLTSARIHLRRLLQPHAMQRAIYDGRPVTDEVRESVLGYLFAYTLSFALVAMLLGLFGLDMHSALTASVSALGNVGPGLSNLTGLAQTYAALPDISKLVLCLAMLTGRLELFLPMVLFVPGFWSRS